MASCNTNKSHVVSQFFTLEWQSCITFKKHLDQRLKKKNQTGNQEVPSFYSSTRGSNIITYYLKESYENAGNESMIQQPSKCPIKKRHIRNSREFCGDFTHLVPFPHGNSPTQPGRSDPIPSSLPQARMSRVEYIGKVLTCLHSDKIISVSPDSELRQ